MPRSEVLTACTKIAATQYAVISAAQAVGAGLSPAAIQRLVRSGAWTRLRPRTYAMWMLPDPRGRWRQGLMAAALWLGEAGAVSHRSALIVWELEGMATAPVELTTTGNFRSLDRGIVLHRAPSLEPPDVTTRDGMRITSVPRTLVDLGSVASPSVVEKALESALRLGLASVDSIRFSLTGSDRRRRRVSVLEALLDQFPGPATESVLETVVWALLRDAGLPAPERQYEIRDDAGYLIARVDFAYPGALLALEADGHRFHSSRRDWQKDRGRQNALVRLGWKVYRITWDDATRRGRQVVSDIAGLLRAPQILMKP